MLLFCVGQGTSWPPGNPPLQIVWESAASGVRVVRMHSSCLPDTAKLHQGPADLAGGSCVRSSICMCADAVHMCQVQPG